MFFGVRFMYKVGYEFCFGPRLVWIGSCEFLFVMGVWLDGGCWGVWFGVSGGISLIWNSSQLTSQPSSLPPSQPANQQANQPASQPTSSSKHGATSPPPASQPANQSSQPASQSASQPASQGMDLRIIL